METSSYPSRRQELRVEGLCTRLPIALDKASLLDWCNIDKAGEVGNFLSMSRPEGEEGFKAERLEDVAGTSRKEQNLNVILLAPPHNSTLP